MTKILYKPSDYIYQLKTYKEILLPQWIEKDRKKLWTKLSIDNQKELYLYYSQKEPPKDPFKDGSEVLFYRFNGNANDEYGNYNGSWSGNEQYGDGVWNQSAKFDGNSYINTNFIPNYNYITISFWIKAKEVNSDSCIFHLSYNDENTLCLWQHNGNGNRSLYVNDSFMLNTSIDFLDGNWHHIVITSETKVYVDGILSDTTSQANISNLNKTLIIGADRDTSSINDFLIGNLDNFRLFNRALSEKEVQQLYKLEKPHIISNGDEVFEFFDDFDVDKLNKNKWTSVHLPIDEGNDGTITIQDSYIEINCPNRNSKGIKTTTSFAFPFIIELKQYSYNGYDGVYFGVMDNNLENGDIIYFDYNSNAVWLEYNNAVGNYHTGLSLPRNTNKWVTIKVIVKDSEIQINSEYGIDTIPLSSFLNKYILLGDRSGDNGPGLTKTDFIFVRKYTDPEPTITYGEEETGSFIIDSIKYNKRRKIIVNSQNKLKDFQISIDISNIYDNNVRIVETYNPKYKSLIL